jgi:leucyl aminopeptidase (aminopeptidase T)
MTVMNPIERKKIENAVIQMFRVNMGVKSREKILILSDIPTKKDWKNKDQSEIIKMLSVSLLGKTVADIVREAFPSCAVVFYPYLSIGRSGAEPTETMAKAMKEYDVIVAINSFSITHTEAREAASKAGARVATMRGAIPEMFYPDGPVSVDYLEVERETKFIAGFLTRASEARVVSYSGTNLLFSLKNRRGRADTGINVKPGQWSNLPAGEAYIAPVEGSAEGELVVEKGWFPNLTEEMVITFRKGEVEQIRGGGEVNRMLSQILGLEPHKKKKRGRCNLAELGIGTNPKARRTDITIEAEKIKGTVHIGIGDNSHMGGKVVADYHQDFVIPKPDLFLDDEKIMDQGVWIKK